MGYKCTKFLVCRFNDKKFVETVDDSLNDIFNGLT